MGVADRLLLEAANRQNLGVDLMRALIGVERTGSMEEKPALSLTINDPHDVLMQSRVLVRPVTRKVGTPAAFALRALDLELDGIAYRLSKATRSGDAVILTLTHRGAYFMEQDDSPISASRADVTRALFIRRQVLAVGRRRGAGHRLNFWAPEVRRPMPRAPLAPLSSRAEVDRDVGALVHRAASVRGLSVKGRPLTAAQRQNAAIAVTEAEAQNAPDKATLALMEACIVEPSAPPWGPFDNPPGGDASSVGILQLLATHLHGSTSTHGGRRDVRLVCRLFLTEGFTGRGGAIDLARKNPGKSAGWIAQQVQGSAFPTRYDAAKRDALRVLEAFGKDLDPSDVSGGTYVKPYRFRRPRGVSAWKNTGDLATQVGRRRFVTIPARGVDLFVYSDDEHLLALPPQARIDLGARYVVGKPDYDLDYGKTVRAMRVTVLADEFEQDFAWGLPIILEGNGPAGRWLVWEAREVDGSPAVDLELRQPQAPKLEPASELVERADTSDTPSGTGSGTPVGQVYSRALAISGRGFPYVWGGGHARAGHPDRGTGRDPGVGYDCSGYVAACLDAGGLLPEAWRTGVPVSGEFASSWGDAGEGETLTVWASAQHVFIEFHLKGRKGRYADTSRQAGGSSGPHMRYGHRSTAGFTPRHWPGT